ncbi:CPBP family intramembrane glutamic endopeptidase [Massilia sp. GCM10020059]|uniref:CPBP family intramembrane metalloprotease n=1 Tax=Massilia agrisoli TaxID=2892444 RepID=A0ABS8ISQ2_9BURK|nr:type II CAAX endopeptidase family protein [Massilia agrisoli]MCC6070966.1 CPBP family intramembrane metalloprotease [Massilia agrisoli]
MTTMIQPVPAPKGWGNRLLNFPLTKIVLASLLVVASAGLVFSLAKAIASKEARIIWPELLAALGVLLTYWAYVRYVEKRPAAELSRFNALPEFGAGLLIGAAMVAAEIGILYAAGVYEVTGLNDWTMKLMQPLAVMMFVGVIEEVIGRGIIFRITEESLGSWPAIAISALLFGLAHIPGEGAGVLAIANTVVAGAFFAAAYLLTRRLWLCIGIHVAWNYTLGSIFSISVSGNESTGYLIGKLTGPEWLTGGAYGLEASVLTLLTLVVIGGWLLRMAHGRGHFMASRKRRVSLPEA